MTSSKKTKLDPAVPPLFPGSINPFADGEMMDIKRRDEQWSEFTLTDGATIRIKPVIIEIRKLKNQFAPNGDPIYAVKSAVVTDSKIPDNLKKKG